VGAKRCQEPISPTVPSKSVPDTFSSPIRKWFSTCGESKRRKERRKGGEEKGTRTFFLTGGWLGCTLFLMPRQPRCLPPAFQSENVRVPFSSRSSRQHTTLLILPALASAKSLSRPGLSICVPVNLSLNHTTGSRRKGDADIFLDRGLVGVYSLPHATTTTLPTPCLPE
jgi:hypothetical protein